MDTLCPRALVKTSIGQVLVFIAVMTASLAGDDNYNVMVGRSNDATLLLAGKLTVDVFPPIIISAYDEAPSHAYPPAMKARVKHYNIIAKCSRPSASLTPLF